MKLNELLKNEKYEDFIRKRCIEITSVEYDSRKVKEGSVFVCITGFKTGGP